MGSIIPIIPFAIDGWTMRDVASTRDDHHDDRAERARATAPG